jgi:4-hydroxybenzoate polyprenyltransferase
VLASWSVFGDPFQPVPLIIGIVALVYFIGAMTSKDVVDCEADRRTGTRTLINTFGTKNAAFISLPFLVMPFVMIPVFIHYKLINSYFLPLMIFSIPAFFVFYLMLKQQRSENLENVSAWTLMYVTYLFYAIGFTTLIILGELGQLSFIPSV